MKSVQSSKRVFIACLGGLTVFMATGLSAQTQPPLPDKDTKVIRLDKTGNLRDFADKAGYNGRTEANLAFIVPADALILGLPGGKAGLDTGKWPEGSRLWLTIDGHVYGGGGNGGSGGDIPGAKDGGKGGDAIYVQVPITIVITAKGSIKGGGGGGGGANGGSVGGSGGGGGFPNGAPGEAGSASMPGDTTNSFSERGKYGSPAGGGQGGAKGNPGGAGGNAAMPGEGTGRAGGGPGNAVQKNGHAVTVLNYGQIYGEVF